MEDKTEKVARKVQALLNSVSEGVGKRIRVHPTGIHYESPSRTEPFWWVPVLIDPNEREMYRVYEALSEVEEKFEFEGVRGLFLSPGFLEFNQPKAAG